MDASGVYKPTYHWAHHLIDLIVLDSEPLSFPTCSQLSNMFPCYHHDPRWPTWHVGERQFQRARFACQSPHEKSAAEEIHQTPVHGKVDGFVWKWGMDMYGPPIPGNFNSKRIMNHRLLGYPEFVLFVCFCFLIHDHNHWWGFHA